MRRLAHGVENQESSIVANVEGWGARALCWAGRRGHYRKNGCVLMGGRLGLMWSVMMGKVGLRIRIAVG